MRSISKTILLTFVSVSALLAYGCKTNSFESNSVSPKQIVFKVEPQTVNCHGPYPMKCLVVNGEYFYDHIEGYTHEEGVGRVLKVEETKICDPDVINDCPQDAGVYTYRLLEIVE